MSDIARVLMLGDVIGDAGLRVLSERLPALVRETAVQLVVANGENAASGFGLTRESADAMFASGVHCITGGNHVWEKKGAGELLDGDARILRPVNYPSDAPGHGVYHINCDGQAWCIINVQGRESMTAIDSPFAVLDELLASLLPGTMVLVDCHAESFAEKEALGLYLDGRVAVFAGTHTHIQTADERILPKGTGYIGDLGMCGAIDSIIGVKVAGCLQRNLTQMPIKMEAADGPAMINGAVFTVKADGTCQHIERIRLLP